MILHLGGSSRLGALLHLLWIISLRDLLPEWRTKVAVDHAGLLVQLAIWKLSCFEMGREPRILPSSICLNARHKEEALVMEAMDFRHWTWEWRACQLKLTILTRQMTTTTRPPLWSPSAQSMLQELALASFRLISAPCTRQEWNTHGRLQSIPASLLLPQRHRLKSNIGCQPMDLSRWELVWTQNSIAMQEEFSAARLRRQR